MLNWRTLKFSQLNPAELYEILQIRAEIFVVQQGSLYCDPDGLDLAAWHVIGRDESGVVAYLRVIPPGVKYSEASLGRVLTANRVRGQGLGRELMLRGLKLIAREYQGYDLVISAQQYLQQFYLSLGFETISEPYDEEGVTHLRMRRCINELAADKLLKEKD